MDIDHTTLRRKVRDIFASIPGAQTNGIYPGTSSEQSPLAEAVRREFGTERAGDITFHLNDWTSDAAFLVAVSLFPDQFTLDEIRTGRIIVHVPNHITAAARLAGYPLRDVFGVGPLAESDHS